ncbi:MAG: ribosomal protein L7/L12 [bacterium]
MKSRWSLAGVFVLFALAALIVGISGNPTISALFICIAMMFVAISSSMTNDTLIEETLEDIFEPGTFFVRLEKIDEEQKIALIKVIKEITGLSLRQAKDKVDAVRLGSMSIVIDRISHQQATSIKQMMESVGGTAVVVDNKPLF